MTLKLKCSALWASATLACGLTTPAHAGLITNGGFESGFSGWTRVNQTGSEGTFASQSGTSSPVNLYSVPAPPQGTFAAMTDASGPGSHVLYQDFIVPNSVPGALVSFSLFVNNSNAPNFFTPATLDFATPALNQRARVDIISTTADPFSLTAADVLLALYQTSPGDPLVSGYNSFSIDVTSLLQARTGQTLRLRFAEVDNVAPFNFGVDNVDVNADFIPEPATWILIGGVLFGIGIYRQGRGLLARASGNAPFRA